MSGSGRVHRKASLPRRALTRPRGGEPPRRRNAAQGAPTGTPVDGSRTWRSGAPLRRRPPVRAEAEAWHPSLGALATANRRAGAFERATVSGRRRRTGSRRFPSFAARQSRSAGTVAGRPSAEVPRAVPWEELRATPSVESWEFDGFGQSVSTRTLLSARHACCFLCLRTVPGSLRDRLGPFSGSVPAERPNQWGPSAGSTRLGRATRTSRYPSRPGRTCGRTSRRGFQAAPSGRNRGAFAPEPPFEGNRTGESSGDESPFEVRTPSTFVRRGERAGSVRQPLGAAGSCVASCGARRLSPGEGSACLRLLEAPTRESAPAGFRCVLRGLGPSRPAAADSVLAPARGPRTAHPRFRF
jgi:hypothetical protein